MPAEMVILDCAQIEPSLQVVDVIARLQLGLRRSGRRLHLAHASDELLALIDLAGLGAALRVEVQRQTEQRKKLRRVEEEGDLLDPPV